MEMGKFSKWNNGVRYLLMVIDVFSKFGWIEPVVDRSQNTPDFHFPLRIKAKISEYAPILTFQIALSFQVDFHLTPKNQKKKKKISDFSSIHHRR